MSLAKYFRAAIVYRSSHSQISSKYSFLKNSQIFHMKTPVLKCLFNSRPSFAKFSKIPFSQNTQSMEHPVTVASVCFPHSVLHVGWERDCSVLSLILTCLYIASK